MLFLLHNLSDPEAVAKIATIAVATIPRNNAKHETKTHYSIKKLSTYQNQEKTASILHQFNLIFTLGKASIPPALYAQKLRHAL